MTKCSLALLCAVALPLPASFAQSPAPTPVPGPRRIMSLPAPEEKSDEKPSDENLVLTLSPAGKDGEGFSIIVTSSQTFNLSRNGFNFNGTLNRTGNGAYRLDYALETTVPTTIHTGSSVILRPGEPVQLVKNGEQFYNLRLDHYPPPEAAKPGPPPSITH